MLVLKPEALPKLIATSAKVFRSCAATSPTADIEEIVGFSEILSFSKIIGVPEFDGTKLKLLFTESLGKSGLQTRNKLNIFERGNIRLAN